MFIFNVLLIATTTVCPLEEIDVTKDEGLSALLEEEVDSLDDGEILNDLVIYEDEVSNLMEFESSSEEEEVLAN